MSERQQVNLYQPVADLSRRPFSARAAALSVGAVVAALLAIWAYGTWQLHQVQRSVTALEQQQRRQEVRVNAAGAIHAARANPEALEAHIKELTAEVAVRRRALELLRGGAEGSKFGFSTRLAALARRHVDGLWIDHVALAGSSHTLTLEGVALDADLVPRYLSDLAQDPALVGAQFDRLVIERAASPDKQGLLSAHGDADVHANPSKGLRFRAESGLVPVGQHAGARS